MLDGRPGHWAGLPPGSALGELTHWSLHKMAAYLGSCPGRWPRGGSGCRQILHTCQISFQPIRTWKESADPDQAANLDRIEHLEGDNRLCSPGSTLHM